MQTTKSCVSKSTAATYLCSYYKSVRQRGETFHFVVVVVVVVIAIALVIKKYCKSEIFGFAIGSSKFNSRPSYVN